MNPLDTDPFLRQYAGTRTYSIQSAFRRLPGKRKQTGLEKIRAVSPTLSTIVVPDADKQRIIALCKNMSALWRPTIESICPLINAVCLLILCRGRERLQHIGSFGYSRGIARCVCHVHRVFDGRSLFHWRATGIHHWSWTQAGADKQSARSLETYYPAALRDDLQHAGKILNREISLLAKSDAQFVGIPGDIAAIESILGIQLTGKNHIISSIAISRPPSIND